VDEKITRESLDRLQLIDVLKRIHVFDDRQRCAALPTAAASNGW